MQMTLKQKLLYAFLYDEHVIKCNRTWFKVLISVYITVRLRLKLLLLLLLLLLLKLLKQKTNKVLIMEKDD